jgi:hypothetical protein
MRLILFSLALFLFISVNITAQKTLPTAGLGLELQAYPTGQLISITFEKMWQTENAFHIRAGYNRVRHGDAGVHDEESGGGFGGTIGYRRYFKEGHKSWHLGIRSDVWFNTIDWKDFLIAAAPNTGTSNIIVLQPTIEAGYLFLFKKNYLLDFSLAFGREFNVITKGEPTGEGFILLAGISIGKRF